MKSCLVLILRIQETFTWQKSSHRNKKKLPLWQRYSAMKLARGS
uniref:Uncharacterized protein n=1 Tax=Arundo donax TaxID=35708 RepID=A0A0A9ANF2_ARUDO